MLAVSNCATRDMQCDFFESYCLRREFTVDTCIEQEKFGLNDKQYKEKCELSAM